MIGEQELSSGVALYLDDVQVTFDGFRALRGLSLSIDVGELRCVIGPNGAGKTTMMDVITGKTRPERATVYFGRGTRPDQMNEPQIAAARHRPQVPEADRVREPTVSRTISCSRSRRRAAVRATLFGRPHREQMTASANCWSGRARRQGQVARRPALAWAEAMARDRHAAGAGPVATAARRAGRRHDRSRDEADGGAAAVARRRAIRSWWWSTIWISSAPSRAR